MDEKKKKQLTEDLAAIDADALEEIAPHLIADIGAQAVEAYREEHPASETKSKDKPSPKDGSKDEEDPKIKELQGKLKKYEEKECAEEIDKLVSAEVEKFVPKIRPQVKLLINAHIKAMGEIEDTKTARQKAVEEAVEAAEKALKESKIGEIKVAAPATGKSDNATESVHPFAHAGFTDEF